MPWRSSPAIWTTRSTRPTYASISALYGLTNNIIDQQQYTILVTAVILSAVVPTMIAQRWFLPTDKPLEEPDDDATLDTDVSVAAVTARNR